VNVLTDVLIVTRKDGQKPIWFDEKELKTDLGTGNFIFIGSSCDLFARDICRTWITETLVKTDFYIGNKFLFQTKNPDRIKEFINYLPDGGRTHLCTTIESDSYYPEIMKDSPHPMQRSISMGELSHWFKTFVTIEPVLDFNLEHMVKMIKRCNPAQVNIGADSGNNHLPEPSKEKLLALIDELKKFTTIDQKRNLKRLLF
jgi:DNA repair photolyase